MHLADASPSAMAAGACVFDRDSSRVLPRPRWIILRLLDSGRVEAMPLIPTPSPMQRGDVSVQDDDLRDLGVPISVSYGQGWAIRTSERRMVRPSIRLGSCSQALWHAVGRAIRQAGETARIEARASRAH